MIVQGPERARSQIYPRSVFLTRSVCLRKGLRAGSANGTARWRSSAKIAVHFHSNPFVKTSKVKPSNRIGSSLNLSATGGSSLDGRPPDAGSRAARWPGGCKARTPRAGRGRPPPLSSCLSLLSLSVQRTSLLCPSSRPLPSVYDVRSMRHPRYYSLHSEAASSGKELLGRLSLWRVQVDRGHRPLGAVFGLAPPARLYRGSRAVSRKLPTGQLPTGDR